VLDNFQPAESDAARSRLRPQNAKAIYSRDQALWRHGREEPKHAEKKAPGPAAIDVSHAPQ